MNKLLSFIFILGLLLVLLFSLETNSVTAANSNRISSFRKYDDLVKDNKIKPQKQIIEISFQYDKNGQPPLSFINISKKNGYAPKYKKKAGDYQLEIVDKDGNVLYATAFKAPKRVENPPPLKGESPQGLSDLPKINFALTTPWFDNAQIVRVLDKDKKTILEKSITTLPTTQNAPQFNSITGDEFLKSKSQTFKLPFSLPFISEAQAQFSDNQYLDIVFIGDDFSSSQMGTFHQNINDSIANMLTYEPYKSRASQIMFHFVDNTQDLDCSYSGRFMFCDLAKVSQIANDSGVPYDQIMVIVNNDTYGGTAFIDYNVGIMYNGFWGPNVFVHEFGHSFGDLLDEYTIFDNGYTDGTAYQNCFMGTPPAGSWAAYVASKDYTQGCNASNWYRSSPSSIMLAIDTPYHNAVSQNLLNKNLDFYASSYQDSGVPTTTITNVQNGGNVSGYGNRFEVSASDNAGVARVELWNDGVLYQTLYQAPFDFYWFSPNGNKDHKIQSKAYDTAGNVGTSPEYSITVGDVSAPTVWINSPSNNNQVSKTVTIKADASDDVRINELRFYVDALLIGADNSYPYQATWDTTSYSNGNHIIKVEGLDDRGNVGTATIAVSVNNGIDTVLPVVSIQNPAANAIVTGTVRISADATDDKGIKKVVFLVNNQVIGEDTTRSYQVYWRTSDFAPGNYTITAQAIDLYNNSSQAQVSVKIPDKTKPKLTITAPKGRVTVAKNTPLKISADATDAGGIDRVEFYVEKKLKCTDSQASYECDLMIDSSFPRSTTVEVKAYDLSGNVSSSSIRLTIR